MGIWRKLVKDPADAVAWVVLVASVAAAGAALLAAWTATPAKAQEVQARVVGYRCDGARGVNALQIAVSGPGVVVLEWKNDQVCGKAV